MAYQTRNRSTRPGSVASAVPDSRQPQIVYLTQQGGTTNTNPQTQAASYMTTNIGQFAQMNNQQTQQQPQQQQQQQPLPNTQQLAAAAAAATAVMTKMEADAGYEDIMDDGAAKPGDEETATRPKWMKKRKEAAFKVSKKVRRKRMNAKLRRILQPKNAIMVLNELKESVKFTFHEQTNAMQQNYFVVTVEVSDKADVDGQTYTGQGLSKPAAKQNAAENALKALLLEKMAQNAQGVDAEGDVTMKEETPLELGPPGTDVPPGEEPPLLDEEGKPVGRPLSQQPEDDVPWGSLASFALFKLFNDWQSQGTQLPIARPGGGGGASGPSPTTEVGLLQENRGPAPMKKLPDNPTDRHPVMLLNQLRPSLIFNDVNMQGAAPNVVFTMSVTIDGASYQGMGKNKKEAKKEAAKSALAAIFNIHYDN